MRAVLNQRDKPDLGISRPGRADPDARPNRAAFAAVSATSSVPPSKLTSRHFRYQAPCVPGVAIGPTIMVMELFNGS